MFNGYVRDFQAGFTPSDTIRNYHFASQLNKVADEDKEW
jgi:hypothetical protein